MKIDIEALRQAASFVWADLGLLDDFPPELRNTLANVYYRFFYYRRNLMDPSQILDPDDPDGALNYLNSSLKGSIEAVAHFEHAKRLVKSMRETRQQDVKSYDYQVTLLLDIFKYKISNAHKKTPVQRAVERKFSAPSEVEGLYEQMVKMRTTP